MTIISPTTRPGPRPGELLLWAILGAFIGYEVVAHVTGYRYGRTLSAIIRQGEHSKILAAAITLRILIACAVLYLGLHLEGVAP